jgi:hypothetical protein
MEQILQIIAPLLSAYAGDYGWTVQVVSVIGTLRLFFKPIMAAVSSAVKETPSLSDDVILNKVTGNAFYKGFIFVIDLIGSIKIKPKK